MSREQTMLGWTESTWSAGSRQHVMATARVTVCGWQLPEDTAVTAPAILGIDLTTDTSLCGHCRRILRGRRS